MLRFLMQRLLALIPVLFVVAVVVFLILRLTPGDPAAVIAGNHANNEDIDRIREQLGLTKPLITQFMIWPGTMVLAVLVAVPLGTLAAWRMGGWLDRILSGFAVAGFSVPVFVIGYVLIWVFAIELQWLPVQGYRRLFGEFSQGVGAWAAQLVLPWCTLATIYVALIARVTRASVSEALTEDYIRTARAKGITEQMVLLRHALANAAVPIVTVIGIGIALLIGGVVVTETVYSIPGLGSLTVDAVLNRDFPVIQGVVLFFSLLYVLINLWLDPRIRY